MHRQHTPRGSTHNQLSPRGATSAGSNGAAQRNYGKKRWLLLIGVVVMFYFLMSHYRDSRSERPSQEDLGLQPFDLTGVPLVAAPRPTGEDSFLVPDPIPLGAETSAGVPLVQANADEKTDIVDVVSTEPETKEDNTLVDAMELESAEVLADDKYSFEDAYDADKEDEDESTVTSDNAPEVEVFSPDSDEAAVTTELGHSDTRDPLMEDDDTDMPPSIDVQDSRNQQQDKLEQQAAEQRSKEDEEKVLTPSDEVEHVKQAPVPTAPSSKTQQPQATTSSPVTTTIPHYNNSSPYVKSYHRTSRYIPESDLGSADTAACRAELTPQPLPQSLYFLHVPKAGGSALAMRLVRLMYGAKSDYVHVKADCFSPRAGSVVAQRKQYADRKEESICTNDDWGFDSLRRPVALPRNNSKSANCTRIISCLDHRPQIEYLGIPGIPSVLLVRDPLARLVSGWHFGFPHRPANMSATFDDYIRGNTHINILTRMMGGYLYPYTDEIITEAGWRFAQQSMEQFDIVLIQEAWQTSVRLLLARFGYSIGSDSLFLDSHALVEALDDRSVFKPRVNSGGNYEKFKARVLSHHVRLAEIRKLNQRDYVLYDRAIERFCDAVALFPCLLRDPVVVGELYESNLCQHLF